MMLSTELLILGVQILLIPLSRVLLNHFKKDILDKSNKKIDSVHQELIDLEKKLEFRTELSKIKFLEMKNRIADLEVFLTKDGFQAHHQSEPYSIPDKGIF